MVHLNQKNYSGVKAKKNIEAVLETNSEAEYTYDLGQTSAEDFGSLQQQVSDQLQMTSKRPPLNAESGRNDTQAQLQQKVSQVRSLQAPAYLDFTNRRGTQSDLKNPVHNSVRNSQANVKDINSSTISMPTLNQANRGGPNTAGRQYGRNNFQSNVELPKVIHRKSKKDLKKAGSKMHYGQNQNKRR